MGSLFPGEKAFAIDCIADQLKHFGWYLLNVESFGCHRLLQCFTLSGLSRNAPLVGHLCFRNLLFGGWIVCGCVCVCLYSVGRCWCMWAHVSRCVYICVCLFVWMFVYVCVVVGVWGRLLALINGVNICVLILPNYIHVYLFQLSFLYSDCGLSCLHCEMYNVYLGKDQVFSGVVGMHGWDG